MDLAPLLANLLSAPVLFFALGIIAALAKSDLDLPHPIPKLLSLYLLMAIGLKGGVELAEAGFTSQVVAAMIAAVALSAVMPLWVFFILRRRLGTDTAAGVAATYGSISAVTFIIATSFLTDREVAYGGHMVAAMALMESPAIITGIFLARRFADNANATEIAETDAKQLSDSGGGGWGRLLHDAALNGAVVLLLGALLIGAVIGPERYEAVKPFTSELFLGVLCLFLLDMGLLAARRLSELRRAGVATIGFGLVSPPLHALLGIALARALGLEPGDALLLAVLAGSASYIAVPAALRLALPAANPSVYVPMSLGVTFPFNVVVGIPLYWAVVQAWWGVGS